MARTARRAAGLAAACALAAAPAHAALGEPDPAFGTGGVAFGATGTVVDADLDLAGRPVTTLLRAPAGAAALQQIVIARTAASGASDPGWGDGGETAISDADGFTSARAAAAPDGTWVVAGFTQGNGIQLRRLDANGNVIATGEDLNGLGDVADVEVGPDAILVAGTGPGGQVFVQPYSGALQPNGDAMLAGSGWEAFALDVDAAGRILVAGWNGADGVVTRFAAGGGVDPDFGTRVIAVPGSTLHDVEALPDGRILVAGGTAQAAVVARLTDSGTPDPAFGSAASPGTVTHQRDGQPTRFRDVLVDATGGIYAAGDVAGDLLLYRLDDRGFPDATLQPSGSRRVPLASPGAGLATGLDAQERPHVLGGGSGAVAVRLLANAAPSAVLSAPGRLLPGQVGSFDASGSTDPERALRRFEWDLDGDGSFETDSATTAVVTHAYATAGTRRVSVRVTDHRGLQSAAGGDVAVAPAAQGEPPRPVLGRAFVGRTTRGTILIRPPGARRYRPLRAQEQIPEGTLVDARRGRVLITAARDATGATDSALFYLGRFRLTQTDGPRPYTTLSLAGGSFRGCGRAHPKLRVPLADAAASRRRRVVRRLWGDGKGRFRTRGRYASATVRGTKWQTIDRCDGVKLQVVRGAVDFRDLLRGTRARRVRSGRTSFVPSPRRSR